MPETGQSKYALRYTGNYFDNVYGFGYHAEPITFHEFMGKAESAFMYMPEFMQIPPYIQNVQELGVIEEIARQAVVDYITTEFDRLFLGMQDYVRWAQKFENKCMDVAPAFWSQVNMISLMTAAQLAMDESHGVNTMTGSGMRLGGQTVTTDQTGSSNTTGNVKTTQDNNSTQTTDSVSREATATTISAPGEIDSEVRYDWETAADNAHETRSRPGDSQQHSESTTDSTSQTNTAAHSSQVTAANNQQDQNQSTAQNDMEYTNKMFMYEREKGIQVARALLPLEWLRQQLRPMFYMIY
jgi:hypothetical protein